MQSCKCLQVEQNRQDEDNPRNKESFLKKVQNSMYFQTGKSLILSVSKIKSCGQTQIKEFMTHFSAQLTQCTTL